MEQNKMILEFNFMRGGGSPLCENAKFQNLYLTTSSDQPVGGDLVLRENSDQEITMNEKLYYLIFI